MIPTLFGENMQQSLLVHTNTYIYILNINMQKYFKAKTTSFIMQNCCFMTNLIFKQVIASSALLAEHISLYHNTAQGCHVYIYEWNWFAISTLGICLHYRYISITVSSRLFQVAEIIYISCQLSERIKCSFACMLPWKFLGNVCIFFSCLFHH